MRVFNMNLVLAAAAGVLYGPAAGLVHRHSKCQTLGSGAQKADWAHVMLGDEELQARTGDDAGTALGAERHRHGVGRAVGAR